MTISTTTSDISYTGDGITTIFAVPFVFFTQAEIAVISLVVATDVETTLILTTDYTVSGGNGAVGTVTALIPPAVGTTLTIARMTNRTQLLDYTENDPFPAASHERGLDRVTAVVQEAAAATDRALKVSVTSPITDLTLPSPAADTVLGWNGALTGIENKAIPSGTAVYSSIATTRGGVTTTEAVTPDGLASMWQKGSDIASATTLAKPADANLGGYHLITGTTTIAGLWALEKDGMEAEFRFAGILQLTHNGTSFILPTGANITTAAGDTARFRADGGTPNWRCVSYQRANGQALATVGAFVTVRQTVMSGPVSTDGLSAFGGSTGSATLTASGTLTATASNGFGVSGAVDRVSSIVNPSWTGLTITGVMYLYLDLAADGTATTGSSVLPPTYRWGGSDVITNGQFTFNIQEMVGKVGNGAAAVQTYRVYVGEVDVAGSVTTAIRWYALMGRYFAPFQNTLPSTATPITFNHNIGTTFTLGIPSLVIECITNDSPYVVGDRYNLTTGNSGGGAYLTSSGIIRRNTAVVTTQSSNPFYVPNATTGAFFAPTAANWKYSYQIDRGW